MKKKAIIVSLIIAAVAVMFCSCASGSAETAEQPAYTAAAAKEVKEEAEQPQTDEAAETVNEHAAPATAVPETAYTPQMHICGACGGSGQIYAPVFDANGMPIQEYIPCGACNATGYVYY